MKNNQLINYIKNPIKRFFTNTYNRFIKKDNIIKLWDDEVEKKIINEFPNETEQNDVKELLEDLLSRNNYLLDTLDIRILQKDIVNLFGKPLLERLITDTCIQNDILELTPEELETYVYMLNYKVTDPKERIANLYTVLCKNINLNELKNLNECDIEKVISIKLSNSAFFLQDLNELDNYYENRKNICQKIIDNPEIVNEEYEKEISSNLEEDISDIPFELLIEMKELSNLDRIKYAIIEAKYGMTLEKARIFCNVFGRNINDIKQSEETRIIKELNSILEENNIEKLKEIDLREDYNNYKGTLNFLPNLKNAYTQKYKETLYQIKEEDFIGTQNVKVKNGKKVDVKVYNALGKNNDKADFNMIVTSLGGIYCYNHNYQDIRADWDRANANHTISCSYIGNDFLGVVCDEFLLGFSDIEENEILQARNEDAGTMDTPFEYWDILKNNKFLSPQNQINSSKRYNELLVERKIENKDKLVNRKPTYAVFIAENINDINDNSNDRWQRTKRMAAQLDIPIVVIDATQCAQIELKKVQDMVKLIKEEKRMDLIPDVIHKIENNRATQVGICKNIGNNIFSENVVKNQLEEIIGAIITSDKETFNKGIEEFVNVTKDIKKVYKEIYDGGLEECKTYNYDEYLERLKVLFSTRNGLNENSLNEREILEPSKNKDDIEFN